MSRARDTANLGSTDLATQVELDAATFDDVGLRQDIATLALQQAVGDNAVAYNLPNSFIDQFEDSSGIKSGGFTTTERKTDNEYISTTESGPILFTDNTNTTYTQTAAAAPYHTTTQKASDAGLVGAATSIYVHDQNGFLDVDMPLGHFAPEAGDWTIEFWMRHFADSTSIWHQLWALGPTRDATTGFVSGPETGKDHIGMGRYDGAYQSVTAVSYYVSIYGDDITNLVGYYDKLGASQIHAPDTWYHTAYVRDGIYFYFYIDGVLKKTHTLGATDDEWGGTTADSTGIRHLRFSNSSSSFYFDDFRISEGIARYPSGTAFDKPTLRHTTDVYTKLLIQSDQDNLSTVVTDASESAALNVGGSVISEPTPVSGNRTKVSGVLLYKDKVGTATFGTPGTDDIEVLFTCDGDAGSPTYTTAASYTAVTPVFSTGIKMIKLGETTCSEGDSIGYKVVWKNQVAQSLITQLHGIGLNY